jgi:hypothetical protein
MYTKRERKRQRAVVRVVGLLSWVERSEIGVFLAA